jgi:hypothetical protein
MRCVYDLLSIVGRLGMPVGTNDSMDTTALLDKIL